MVYVDYEYYKNKYLGTLPKDSFDSLIFKASREIDKNVNTSLTQEVINDLQEKAQEQLKYTACALVDLINKKQESESRKLNSISIDGINKSYNIFSIKDYESSKKDILNNLPDKLTCYL